MTQREKELKEVRAETEECKLKAAELLDDLLRRRNGGGGGGGSGSGSRRAGDN